MLKTLVFPAMLLLALPAMAQAQVQAQPAAATPSRQPAPAIAFQTAPQISAGHAAALGTGMFVGALAGSVLINGGALAALIGGAAGVTIGHWYWTERLDDTD